MEKNFENDFIPPMNTVNTGLKQEILDDLLSVTTQIVNVFFVGDPKHSEDYVLIDAGMPGSAEMIIRTAEERFGTDSKPKAIILTHGHFDHVGALSELIEHWNVPIYAHELEIPYLTGMSNYPPADPTVDGGLVAELSPMFPNHGIDLGNHVGKLPSDGKVPGMYGWHWLHTPGHTPGHISIFRVEDRSLIVGDAFVTVDQESLYKVIFQVTELNGPPAYFTTDWQAAWDSVKRLEALKPNLAVTGHGLPIEGEELSSGLEKLAKEFDRIAIPKRGRYVN